MVSTSYASLALTQWLRVYGLGFRRSAHLCTASPLSLTLCLVERDHCSTRQAEEHMQLRVFVMKPYTPNPKFQKPEEDVQPSAGS